MISHNVARVFDVVVNGVEGDERTGCAHYRTALDVIAIRHPCCGAWFACTKCHSALAHHAGTVWPRDAYDEIAILCGVCGNQSSIGAYLRQSDCCAHCNALFNPGCSLHHHLYFELGSPG